MITRRRNALTLVEIVTVAVILTILAVALVPQFTESTDVAKTAAAQFHWHTLKAQIEFYKSHHAGRPPASLRLLTVRTNSKGNTNPREGRLDFGPYLSELPDNPWNHCRRVAAGTSQSPPTRYSQTIGWFYDNSTGDLWMVGKEAGADKLIGQ